MFTLPPYFSKVFLYVSNVDGFQAVIMRFIFLIDKVISSAFLYIMSATPTIILIMINII